MNSSARERTASEAGKTKAEACSADANALKKTVCFSEEAEKREVLREEPARETPGGEGSPLSCQRSNGKQNAQSAAAEAAGVKEAEASAAVVVHSAQQRAGDTARKGRERRKKEETWDRETQVKLICAEGTAIIVDRDIAIECDLFRRMLGGSTKQGTTTFSEANSSEASSSEAKFSEGRKGEINLPTIRRRILEKTVEYLKFRRSWYQNGGHSGNFHVESDIALELLLAANYLGLSDNDAVAATEAQARSL